jgi:hypothetical protein
MTEFLAAAAREPPKRRQVLDCASPLALFTRAGRKAAEDCRSPRRSRDEVFRTLKTAKAVRTL